MTQSTLTALALCFCGGTMWVRRKSWRIRWDRALTMSFLFQGLGFALSAPAMSHYLEHPLFRISGVAHLRDFFGHVLFICAICCVIYACGLPTRTRPRIGISAVQDRIPRRHRRRHHARRHHPQPQPLPGTAPGLPRRAVRLLAPRLLAHLRGHRHLPTVLRRPIVVGVAARPALPAHRRPVHHRQRIRGGIFRRAPHQDHHQPGAGCPLLDLDTFVCGWGVGRVRGSLVVAGEDASALTQETATEFN